MNCPNTPITPCTPLQIPANQSVSEAISLSDISKKLDIIQNTIENIKTEMASYKEIAQNLNDQNLSLRNDNDKLKTQIQNVEYQVECMKQQQLLNNILICGIPETNNENLSSVITNIANKLDVPLCSDDIKILYRKTITGTKSAGLPAPIIVQFTNTKTKNEIMAAKKGKLLDTTITNTVTNKRPIYINDHLTRHRQYLFKQTRDLKRNKHIEYTWSRNGDIYIRQKKDSPAVKIKHIEQLNAFAIAQL